MTKQEAFEDINKIQDEYVEELIGLIGDPNYELMKIINFTSATGTGKTKMMSKLINKLPQYYFVITTLSKGQLHMQIKDSFLAECHYDNWDIYGSCDYKIGSKLEAEDIIGRIPEGKKCIWLRDEGHIRTNRYDELLANVCYKIINFSATNKQNDIQCNFAQTMMLRTVSQETGTPEDAIAKLLEVKEIHKNIPGYNPCALFRCVNGKEDIYKRIIQACEDNSLKHIDISEDPYVMKELCEDDNEYDVIINKFKITEGIDIRRAHVLYMDNQPSNNTTTIQVIGRCRRNALLYRNDIDILAPENEKLLEQTRKCYVYYNVEQMRMDTDMDGNLQMAFCDEISCEALKPNMSVDVINGQLFNGLYVIELRGKTGKFNIVKDKETGFNIVEPITEFYDYEEEIVDPNYIYVKPDYKIHIDRIAILPLKNTGSIYSSELAKYVRCDKNPLYKLESFKSYSSDVKGSISDEVLSLFERYKDKYTRDYIYQKLKYNDVNYLLSNMSSYNIGIIKKDVSDFVNNNVDKRGYKGFCKFLLGLAEQVVYIDSFQYTMSEICSDNELAIISYYCIREKRNRTLDEIVSYVKQFVMLRAKCYSVIYAAQKKVGLAFKDIISIEPPAMSLDEVEQYVLDYLADNRYKYLDFCQMVEYNPINANSLYMMKPFCTRKEITAVQYFSICAKENGVSDEIIRNCIINVCGLRHRFNFARDNKEAEDITYLLLDRNIKNIGNKIDEIRMYVKKTYPENITVTENDVCNYFELWEERLNVFDGQNDVMVVGADRLIDKIVDVLCETENELRNGIIHEVSYDYSCLYEHVTDAEAFLMRNDYIRSREFITKKELKGLKKKRVYSVVKNDKESAVIGAELMKQIRSVNNTIFWTEAKTVSDKISNYCKFNTFISKKYKDELCQAHNQLFTGTNNFDLDTKCNTIIGYCVEYYSKYLVYGEEYLADFINRVMTENRKKTIDNAVIVRACMLKYKALMAVSFGTRVTQIIQVMTLRTLEEEKSQYFINLIVELGTKVAEYVKKTLYPEGNPVNDVDPNLSIKHIAGLADYITEDTILDVKVRNHIDDRSIRQVLAYHYLSTKRSGLHIRRVIVYDAVSDRAAVVNISEANII